MRRLKGQYVRIYSGEHRAWWRPEAHGYTIVYSESGIYDFADAWRRSSHCGPEKKIEYHTADAPRYAFRTIVQGFEAYPDIRWAESAGHARTLTIRAMEDAGYPADYRTIRVRRAPEYDHLAPHSKRLYASGLSEDMIPTYLAVPVPA